MIRFTTFTSRFADRMERRDLPNLTCLAVEIATTIAASKADLPWIKLAAFTGLPNPESKSNRPSLRYDASVWEIYGVEGDYDGGLYTLEYAVECLEQAGVHALVCETASSTPDAPRWRVFCPTSKPYSPTERLRLLARVNGALDPTGRFRGTPTSLLSPESFTLSQAYYYGNTHGRITVTKGTHFIDEADYLDQFAVYKDGSRSAPVRTENRKRYAPEHLSEDDANERLSAEAQRRIHAFITEHGAGTAPRGDRAYRCANWLGDMRTRDNKILSPPRIVELMEAHGFPEIADDILERRENEPGCDEITSDRFTPPDAPLAEAPAAPVPARKPGAQLRRLSDVKMRNIEWLWREWLALGMLHILAGDAGVGKSTLAFDWAATITRGSLWPDMTPAPAGDVLIWSGEDDLERVILPRFRLAGGDVDRCYHVSAYEGAAGEKRAFNPATDMGTLVDAAPPACRLIVVDPIVSAIRGDGHKNNDVRQGLQPLIDLAAARNCAVLGISHFRKNSENTNPLHRLTDSLAYGAAARLVMAASKSEDGASRRLVRVKSNIGNDQGGFAFELAHEPVEGAIVSQRIRWLETLTGTAKELIGGTATASKTQAAAAFIIAQLEENGGCMPTQQLKQAAQAFGHAWRTIEDARQTIPVRPFRNGLAYWWQIVDPATGVGAAPIP